LRPAVVVGWVLLIGAAAAVVVRVARLSSTLPMTAAEPGLVDAAYGRVTGLTVSPVDNYLTVSGLQLDAYASLSGAFDRQVSTLVSAREMSVVAVAVMLFGLVLVAAMLRVRPLVTTVAVAMIAVSGPVITTLTPVGPGVATAAWATLASAAAFAAIARPNGALVLAGLIASLIAVATTPVLVVPIGVGAASWFAGRRRLWALGTTLVVTAGIAFGLWRGGFLDSAGLLDSRQRLALVAVIAAAAAGGLLVIWLRPVAAGTAGGAVLVAVTGIDALVPVLVAAAAVLVAVGIDDIVTRPRATVKWVPAAVAVTGSVAGALLLPAAGRPIDHAGLSEWVAGNLDRDTRLVVPAGLWSDVARDRTRAGLPASGVRQAGASGSESVVVALGQQRPAGVELARFGSTPTEITVLTRNDEVILAEADRARAGTELASNFRLHTTEEVLTAMRSGRVDLRVMAVLAELCREGDVTVRSVGKPTAERGSSLPDRVIELSTTGSAAVLRDWLTAQQQPYGPADVRLTADGVVATWRLQDLHGRSPR
jgi:hypothetical protein